MTCVSQSTCLFWTTTWRQEVSDNLSNPSKRSVSTRLSRLTGNFNAKLPVVLNSLSVCLFHSSLLIRTFTHPFLESFLEREREREREILYPVFESELQEEFVSDWSPPKNTKETEETKFWLKQSIVKTSVGKLFDGVFTSSLSKDTDCRLRNGMRRWRRMI